MDIVFEDKQFARECDNYRLLERNHGKNRAKKILLRIVALRAAEVLEDMRNIQGRCHELGKNRSGQFSLDLDGPYRLIFEPANEPIPKKLDGGIDWNQVTAVKILGVDNTHE